MRPIRRPELAALFDLGLSDDILARYLATDAASIAALRKRDRPGECSEPENCLSGPPAAQVSEHAGQVIAGSKLRSQPPQQAPAAEQACDQVDPEASLPRMMRTPQCGTGAPPQDDTPDLASVLMGKAKRWQLRADEYRSVSEALRTALARDTYEHLARSYERVAEQFAERARVSLAREENQHPG